MNAANQRQLTPVLALLAVLLGAVLLLLLGGIGRGVRWDAPRPPAPLPPAARQADLPQPVPLQQYALVWQRPLFSPDRKPTARAGGGNLGDLELTGIILTPGLRMALLHDRNGDKQVRLREGEALPDGSVRLVELRPRSALFDSSAGRTELKLPAGAPIDQPRGAADVRGQPPAGDAAVRLAPDAAGAAAVDRNRGGAVPMHLAPAAAPPPAPESAAERLRKSIQKRRAARAAATHEGEH
ncbi:general secretion pathway protein GspN [Rhodanobacter sp. B2A1Ga4]|uniref:general secretion pathway protein GspN n=1 Tax=Rhodanobacter TaxID=75309 RepID=UPI000D3C3FF0|nr:MULTISPECIES: general secretion pathway protein GspN [Rhodanobacter]MBQ4854995.1 general secretion pathway protein GspN [Rhodanobacter sp. B2A1Ga4]